MALLITKMGFPGGAGAPGESWTACSPALPWGGEAVAEGVEAGSEDRGDKAQVAMVTFVGYSGTRGQVVEWKATVKAKKSFPQFIISS